MSDSAHVLGAVDRALYALFSRHADAARHGAARRWYRGTSVTTSFDVYIARTYGLSWLAFALAAGWTLVLLTLGAPGAPPAAADAIARLAPPLAGVASPPIVVGVATAGAGLGAKRATVWLGGAYLRWAARARRADIERTLPGAVRYLHALAAGSRDERAMLAEVAGQRAAYGETAASFRAVLNKAALTGSLGTGLRVVARDTPAEDTLAPFLLKYREYADQGDDALAEYLRLEGRMLGRRQFRERRQAEGFLELLAELFIVLLVLPTLLIIVLTVLSVLAPGLGRTLSTPVGDVTVRVALVYACAVFVLAVGALAAWLVQELSPPNARAATHPRSDGWAARVRNALRNPADAAVVAAPLAVAAALVAWRGGATVVDVALLGYVAYGLPVGAVALRRARIDDEKDREIKDFVHAVSGHVALGRPFPDAVEHVARDVDLGELGDDVADLAFNIRVSGRGDDVQGAAMSRFVERVGTPLAEQTVGLVTGALDVGADPETVFDTLQAEIGRLYHEKRALRANLAVYVAVGWTTAILVVGVTVAINSYVLESFDQLATVSDTMGGFVLDPAAVDPARDRYRFYVVTQATMLACGWFAGFANRGRYDALLHSASLVLLAHVVFRLTGAI